MLPFTRGVGMDNDAGCTAAASDNDMDDTFDEDMEALRRACLLTGKVPEDAVEESDADSGGHSCESDELHILRNIQERFSIPQSEMDAAPNIKPLSTILPPDSDEDDFETLRAIQRRFEDYHKEDLSKTHTQLSTSGVKSRSGIPHNVSNGQLQSQEVPGEEFGISTSASTTSSVSANGYYLLNQEKDESGPCSSMVATHSHFPRSCQMIVDALKKNRSCQRFIRNTLIHIEGKLGENKDLKERVKLLVEFKVSCKRRAGLALSQKKDPCIKLISLPSSTAPVKYTRKEKKMGPAENSHVSKYKMVMGRFPVSINKQPWSPTDKEKLVKGIKQQYLEMLMLNSMGPESGEMGNSDTLYLPSVGDCDVASEEFRSFLSLVNWERLALMYFTGRTGAECQTRWLNHEDPLINNLPWTRLEEKALLAIAQERGVFDWIAIAVRLGTSRTPFQCLMHYQRSLNAYILKKDWTEEEDAQLRAAIELYGEDWQLVASNLEGRSGNQCSNRWRKTLHPDRQRVGRWSVDEDKRLKAAVMLFGQKNWYKIAQFAPGRTQVQCRERWVNCLNPALNLEPWTEEEDTKLKEAIIKFGYCWSKIASVVAPRTDNQCRRRWKVLFPSEVPVRQVAWKVQKAALMSNFVDRERERPLIGPSDFCPVEIGISAVNFVSGPVNGGRKKKPSDPDRSVQLQRGRATTKKRKPVINDQTALSEKNRDKKRRKHLQSAQECSNDSDFHVPLSCLTYGSSSQAASGVNDVPCLTSAESSALSHQASVYKDTVKSKPKWREKHKPQKRLLAESSGSVQNMRPPVVAKESLTDHCSQLMVDGTVISEDNTSLSERRRKCTQNHTLRSPEELPLPTLVDSQAKSSENRTQRKNPSKRKCSQPAKKHGVLQQYDSVTPDVTNAAVSSLIGSMDGAPSAADTVYDVGATQNGDYGGILFASLDDEMRLSEFITAVKKEVKKKKRLKHYSKDAIGNAEYEELLPEPADH